MAKSTGVRKIHVGAVHHYHECNMGRPSDETGAYLLDTNKNKATQEGFLRACPRTWDPNQIVITIPMQDGTSCFENKDGKPISGDWKSRVKPERDAWLKKLDSFVIAAKKDSERLLEEIRRLGYKRCSLIPVTDQGITCNRRLTWGPNGSNFIEGVCRWACAEASQDESASLADKIGKATQLIDAVDWYITIDQLEPEGLTAQDVRNYQVLENVNKTTGFVAMTPEDKMFDVRNTYSSELRKPSGKAIQQIIRARYGSGEGPKLYWIAQLDRMFPECQLFKTMTTPVEGDENEKNRFKYASLNQVQWQTLGVGTQPKELEAKNAELTRGNKDTIPVTDANRLYEVMKLKEEAFGDKPRKAMADSMLGTYAENSGNLALKQAYAAKVSGQAGDMQLLLDRTEGINYLMSLTNEGYQEEVNHLRTLRLAELKAAQEAKDAPILAAKAASAAAAAAELEKMAAKEPVPETVPPSEPEAPPVKGGGKKNKP